MNEDEFRKHAPNLHHAWSNQPKQKVIIFGMPFMVRGYNDAHEIEQHLSRHKVEIQFRFECFKRSVFPNIILN
jgi:hypothetical protein